MTRRMSRLVTMPELPNRFELERELTQELSRVLNQARQEIVSLVWASGNESVRQGDLSQVPQSVWATLQREIQRTLQLALADAFVSAAENFAQQTGYGLDMDQLAATGQQWAAQYAPQVAAQMVDTRRDNLQQLAQTAPDVALRRRDLVAVLLGGLAIGTIATAAITELTHANSQGERYVSEQLREGGVQVEEVWQTREDERVCPVCAPLHDRSDGWQFPPPKHPRCRCYLAYRLTWPDGRTVTTVYEGIAEELNG